MERKEPKKRIKRNQIRPPDRIKVDQRLGIGKELRIEGPPIEALLFQGARTGSIVTVTDSQGEDFRGRVSTLHNERASILVFDRFPLPTESPLEVILLQALPEKERMEWIIQKATELGVSMIVPFKSEKSISLKERDQKQEKSPRWQHIAIRAVQQSRRARVPLVEEYCSFRGALNRCKGPGLRIALWEKEGKSLRGILREYSFRSRPFEGTPGFPSKVYCIVGPEGGFTDNEIAHAREKGFLPVKLGHRILRTETAAITIVGILQYELGDLG